MLVTVGPVVRAARTTRPGRSRGAAATCRRAPRAPPRREPAAPLRLALPSPPASGRAAPAAGCGNGARSPPATAVDAPAATRTRGTSSASPWTPRASLPDATTAGDARVGDWIIECATASELLARVRGDTRRATDAPVALAAMYRQWTQLPRQPTLAAHSSRAFAYA